MKRTLKVSEAAEDQGHGERKVTYRRPADAVSEPGPDPTPEQQAKVKALIRDITRKLATTDKTAALSDPLLDAVTFHARRLRARGVEAQAAQRQAEAMVQDPAHRATCAFCRDGVPF